MRMALTRFGTKGLSMPTKYLPSKDANLQGWINAFAQNISSDPESFGLTVAIAQTYSGKAAAFASAMAAATSGETRGNLTVFRKDEIRADLIAYTRLVVRSVQGCMSVTDVQRQSLGITIRANPTRIARPAGAACLKVRGVLNRRLTLAAYALETNSSGKPSGVAGVNVFYLISDLPSEDPSAWSLLASSTKARFDVMLPATVTPGTKVWLVAGWFNPRAQRGPNGNPISVTVGAVGVEFPSLAA